MNKDALNEAIERDRQDHYRRVVILSLTVLLLHTLWDLTTTTASQSPMWVRVALAWMLGLPLGFALAYAADGLARRFWRTW